MSAPPDRWRGQLFGLVSLVVPPALAWNLAFAERHPTRLIEAVVTTLGPLWLLTATALAVRCVGALLDRRREGAAEITLLDRLDVLTSTGRALAWSSSLAIALAVGVGWASLALVGLMGSALLYLVVLATLLVAGGGDPFRRASIERRFSPAVVVEGGAVIEEIRLDRPRIPIGFRLLGEGRIGSRWATSRYVVDDGASGGELTLESEIGPAFRGEHRAEPLLFWLQDVFGLCRSLRLRAGAAELTVLPALYPVTGAKSLLGPGGRDREPRPAQRLPTEGSLHLRDYQPGDDARRVHWVRSLAGQKLIVRTPDELPPDQPSVRVVLDTFLPGAEGFACSAPAALLDALVEVWISVGRALADAGARVTLVLPVPSGDTLAPQALRLGATTHAEALRLGAAARWQSALPVEAMLERGATFLVSCRIQPLLAGAELSEGARWILVPEPTWTCFDEAFPARSVGRFPLPLGTRDNRLSRRQRAQRRWWAGLRDHTAFSRHAASGSAPRPGSFSARPMRSSQSSPRRIVLEALR